MEHNASYSLAINTSTTRICSSFIYLGFFKQVVGQGHLSLSMVAVQGLIVIWCVTCCTEAASWCNFRASQVISQEGREGCDVTITKSSFPSNTEGALPVCYKCKIKVLINATYLFPPRPLHKIKNVSVDGVQTRLDKRCCYHMVFFLHPFSSIFCSNICQTIDPCLNVRVVQHRMTICSVSVSSQVFFVTALILTVLRVDLNFG